MDYFHAEELRPMDAFLIFFSGLMAAQLVAIPIAFGVLDPASAFVFFSVAVLQDGLFIILVAALLKIRAKSWLHIRLGHLEPRHVVQGFIGGAALYVFMSLAILLLQAFLPGGLPPQNVEAYMDPAASFADKTMVFFVVVFLAPLAEEILFRGYLLRALENFVSSKAAILWSGLLFGVVHGDLLRLLPLALGGWVLGLMAKRSHSLWPAILAHSIWNFIMVLVLYVYQ